MTKNRTIFQVFFIWSFIFSSFLVSAASEALSEGISTSCDSVIWPPNVTTSPRSPFRLTALQNSTKDDQFQGWTPRPEGRGTIDIIWSSIATIFLCCWTALCVNVPPSYWSSCRYMYHKFLLAGLCMLGPEFIFQLALGQWVSARRSVQEFKRSGYPDWTMKHAFLADMGGFVLSPRDWMPFPLNAKQVHYLVVNNYVPYSAVCLDKREIEDRNKGDSVARLITVFQVLWFTANCISRWIQHIAITTLELTTLGFIICTLGTYYFWAHKPLDVKYAIVLEMDISLVELLTRAGESAQEQYKLTPLDFVSPDLWSWKLYWTYWMNILRKLHIELGAKRRPIDKIPDDNWPAVTGYTRMILFLVQVAYGAVTLCGWNVEFPSRIERILWHISTLVIMVTIVITWIADQYTWHILPFLRNHFSRHVKLTKLKEPETSHPRLAGLRTKALNVAEVLRNNSPGHEPALIVPLKALIPVTIAGACYSFARAYIIVEDFINLRALPATAYQSVNWSAFLPHL